MVARPPLVSVGVQRETKSTIAAKMLDEQEDNKSKRKVAMTPKVTPNPPAFPATSTCRRTTRAAATGINVS
jgi:hypothetical protein